MTATESAVHEPRAPTVLYAFLLTPLLFRIVDSRPSAADVSLAYLPGFVLVVALELAKPRLVHDEVEHELRHAVYFVGFVVALATGVRWEEAYEEYPYLLMYAIVGSLTLLWFVASHLVENRVQSSVHTHQGDVVVLPMTLVAIATFSREIPLPVLRAGRAILFYVPVFVAWATLHLVAYNDFSSLRTTTMNHRFYHCVFLALPVATIHLVLIETGAGPALYLLSTFTAAFLAQIAYPVSSPVVPREQGWKSFLFVALLFSSVLPFAVFPYLPGTTSTGTAELAFVYVYSFFSLAAIVPRIAGESWTISLSFYVTLLVCSYVYREREQRGEPFFPMFCFALTLFAARITQVVCGEVTCPRPPLFDPSTVTIVCPPVLAAPTPEEARACRDERPSPLPPTLPRALSGCWKCVGTTSNDRSGEGVFLCADAAGGATGEDGTVTFRLSELRWPGGASPLRRALDSSFRVRLSTLALRTSALWTRCETEVWYGVGFVGIPVLRRTVWLAVGLEGGNTAVAVRLDKNEKLVCAWRFARGRET